MPRNARPFCVLLVAVLCGTQSVVLSAQDIAGGGRVIVKTIEPDVIHARLSALSLSDGLVLHTKTGDTRRIPTSDLVRIATTARVSERSARDVELTLASGDVLYGKIDTADDDDAVVIDTLDLGRLSVPLDVVTRLETPLTASGAYRESIGWFDRKGGGDTDQILLTNGDLVSGFITAIGHRGVSIETELGDALVPYRLVVAARLASALPPALERPYMVVRLRSSGRMTVADLSWADNVVETRLWYGPRAALEAERVVAVEVVGGRWEWLGQHQPISYEHTPMLSMNWEYARDGNVLGGPISVAGETHEHGVGVHSRSSLTYDLKGAYREFVTYFGIDDDSGPYADVSVFVLVDGKRRFDQSHVRRGKLFGPVRLDVARAKRIELIVDFGDNGDLQDRFNWVAAALIR